MSLGFIYELLDGHVFSRCTLTLQSQTWETNVKERGKTMGILSQHCCWIFSRVVISHWEIYALQTSGHYRLLVLVIWWLWYFMVDQWASLSDLVEPGILQENNLLVPTELFGIKSSVASDLKNPKTYWAKRQVAKCPLSNDTVTWVASWWMWGHIDRSLWSGKMSRKSKYHVQFTCNSVRNKLLAVQKISQQTNPGHHNI